MNKDKKTLIIVIAALLISVIGLGIAFAAFSQTLAINGSAEVEATSWEIVFEGTDGTATLGAPTLTGTASVVTAPTIKNNQTEISNYSVTLQAPGDAVTYNFKIHNKGDFAASLSSLTISGVNRPSSPVSGAALVTDSSIATENINTLNATEYKLYYTDNNNLVGQDEGKDCLEPGESEYVSLRITFASSTSTDTSILPSSDLVLDNLGVSITYTQCGNGSCQVAPTPTPTGDPFVNTDGAYYTYEGKSFIGTGADNVIITENITSLAKWSSASSNECSDGSIPTATGTYDWEKTCPEGTTLVFVDHPAADAAAAYCSGCRLMTKLEAESWGCTEDYPPITDKCAATYNGYDFYHWWLADVVNSEYAWFMDCRSYISYGDPLTVFSSDGGVRPVVSIPSTATMTGTGTQADPYVIQ